MAGIPGYRPKAAPIRDPGLRSKDIKEAEMDHCKARVLNGQVESVTLFARDAEGRALQFKSLATLDECLKEWSELRKWVAKQTELQSPAALGAEIRAERHGLSAHYAFTDATGWCSICKAQCPVEPPIDAVEF